jgi:hypothetical protein
MKLKGLIGNIENNAPLSKTASYNDSQGLNVSSAIEAALAQAEAVKTASERRNPSEDLEKMAFEVAQGNRMGEVGHVEKLGSAMADSFVRQLAAYETAANSIAQEKAASMQVTAEELEMVMEARHNPQLFIAKVAEAAQNGEQMNEKVAAEIWEQTAQETTRAIHKTAMDHYAAGYASIAQALEG